jgi:hypothetical protein
MHRLSFLSYKWGWDGMVCGELGVVADDDFSCSSKASNISLSSSETFSFLTLSSTVLILQFRQRVGHGSDVLRVVPSSSSCGLIRSCDGPEMRE